MIEKLIQALSSTDFEYYGSLLLEKVHWSDKVRMLILQIEVNLDEEPKFPSKWEIICEEVEDHKITLGYSYDFLFDEDHVLSWEHYKSSCSVSFNGKTDDSLAVVGALYKTHTEIAQNWIPFNKYFNQSMQLDELIAAKFGQIVQNAPDEFSVAYENVLQSYGFLTSKSESRIPSSWHDNVWIPQTVPLSTMIFDKSYVVAEQFKARAI